MSTEEIRQQAQRPGIAVLSFVGWAELALSVIFLLLDLPFIAVTFGIASILMGTIANAIGGRDRWYDRERGIWREDGSPTQRSSNLLIPAVISTALVIGAVAALVAFGAFAVAVTLGIYAIASAVLLTR